MDFLDPQKRRQHTIRLFAGYALVAVAILLTTTILIYYAYGFGVNRSGALVQKGLVFVSSQPTGADIRLNDKLIETTNAKLNLTAGEYAMQLSRDGYRDWRRNISIQGSSVDHYVYPFLIPRDLQTNEVARYETAPALTTQSPDRRWLIALTDTTAGTFDEYDLNRNQDAVGTPRQFTVPDGMLTASETPSTWEVLEWSSNNRHFVVQRSYTASGQAQTEYLLIDRQRPEGSYNLTRELTLSGEELTLFDKKPDAYYLYNPTTKVLSKATLEAPEKQTVLNGVLAYKSHGSDKILYITDKNSKDMFVDVMLREGDRSYKIRQHMAADAYLLNMARFDGDWYAVTGSQAENRALVYKNPVDNLRANKKPESLFALRVDKPTDVSFSANTQYIALQNGKAIHVYDIDYEKAYRYNLPVPLDAPQAIASWMDGNRFTYVGDGKQLLFDYDNINRHSLVPASTTYQSAFDRQYEYIYTFTPPTDGQAGLVLNATALRTQADL